MDTLWWRHEWCFLEHCFVVVEETLDFLPEGVDVTTGGNLEIQHIKTTISGRFIILAYLFAQVFTKLYTFEAHWWFLIP